MKFVIENVNSTEKVRLHFVKFLSENKNTPKFTNEAPIAVDKAVFPFKYFLETKNN